MEKELPSSGQYLAFLTEQTMTPSSSPLSPRGDTEAGETPVARALLDAEGCTVELAAPSGIERIAGGLSGYRTVAYCKGVLVDIEENDYRAPTFQRVRVGLTAALANADFGPGRAMARFYKAPGNGELTTALAWTNDEQEVRLYAVGSPEGLTTAEWNESLQQLMRAAVTSRLAQ